MPQTRDGWAAWRVLSIAPYSAAGLDWPAALALAGEIGLVGEAAIDLLMAGEAGLLAGLKRLPKDEGGTDG